MSHKLHLGLGLIGFVEKPESVVKWWKDRCFSTDVLKMMVLLADFTFEALSMVNASGCPNRLAFDLGSTLSTFLHVRLEGASWWRWLSQRIIEQRNIYEKLTMLSWWSKNKKHIWETHHVVLFTEDLVSEGVVGASDHFLAHGAVLLGFLNIIIVIQVAPSNN